METVETAEVAERGAGLVADAETANMDAVGVIEASANPAGRDERWEDCKNLYMTLEDEVKQRQWKQARILSLVKREWGGASIEHFAFDVGISKTTAYDYLKAYERFGHLEEAERAATLSMTHYIEAAHYADPGDAQEALDEAADEGLSTRAMNAKRQQRNLQRAEQEFAPGGARETEQVEQVSGRPETSQALDLPTEAVTGYSERVPDAALCPHCNQPMY